MPTVLCGQRIPSPCQLHKLGRKGPIRPSQGQLVGARRRSNTALRFAQDSGLDFETVTTKVNLPTVEWQEDFDSLYKLSASPFASGNFGTVWKAKDRSKRKVVAVKRIPIKHPKLSREENRAKVEHEVQVLMELNGHPGVVSLHGAYLCDNHYNVVMDYCSGKDLQSHVKELGPISEGLCAAVAWKVLGVLRRCREAKLVHSDVKAANFVVASRNVNPFGSSGIVALPPGWLKAVDFGSAQYFRGGPKDVLRKRCGTPVYMAPEVLWGHFGHEADMWSLGVTLFYLMSGRYPLWEIQEVAQLTTLLQVKEAVMRGPVSIDPEVVGHPSESCLDFLGRLLIRKAKARMTLEEAMAHPFLKGNLGLCRNGGIVVTSSNIVSSLAMAEHCASSCLLEAL